MDRERTTGCDITGWAYRVGARLSGRLIARGAWQEDHRFACRNRAKIRRSGRLWCTDSLLWPPRITGC